MTSANLNATSTNRDLIVVNVNDPLNQGGGGAVPSTVSILLGNGDGTFSMPATSTTVSDGPFWHRTAADISGDNKDPDLVISKLPHPASTSSSATATARSETPSLHRDRDDVQPWMCASATSTATRQARHRDGRRGHRPRQDLGGARRRAPATSRRHFRSTSRPSRWSATFAMRSPSRSATWTTTASSTS